MLSSGKLILSLAALYVAVSLLLYNLDRKELLLKLFFVVFGSLFLFALYSLFSILKGVKHFDNSMEAFYLLLEELKEAKSDLNSLGFSFQAFDINLEHGSGDKKTK